LIYQAAATGMLQQSLQGGIHASWEINRLHLCICK